MNTRDCIIVALLCGFCAQTAQATGPFYIKAEALYMEVWGGPDYTFSGEARGDDYDRFVPRLDIGYALSDSWALEFSYTHFGELETDWAAPGVPPFPGQEILTIAVDFEVSETIYAPALALHYRRMLSKNWELSLGPSLTYFRNEIEAKPWVDETLEDFELGADVSLSYIVDGRWLFSLDYHYLNPPEKDAHLVGASIGVRF